MQTVLYVLCAMLWIAALVCIFLISGSVFVEILGGILGLSGMVAFAGGAIVGSLDDLTTHIKNQKAQQ